MKRIISASYREDIPAFGAKPFFENVAKGYVEIPTKLGKSRISLRPEDVYENNRQRAHGFNRGMNGAKLL